jgi:two-component system sensor histidine kinase MtrB
VRELQVSEVPYLVASAPWDASASVAFTRNLSRELAILPDLRRTAVWTWALALLFALAVGTLFAGRVARPVGALAGAADRFAAGDVDAPLPRSSVAEVRRVAEAFGSMRQTLAARMAELEEANRALEDRQERLSLLQAELLQRERIAATGHLLAQLAHEIRNPVASVRNCLEVVRRKANLEGEAREFADMAVDELLRMHELAERMLDFHRPRDPGEGSCDVGAVARDVTPAGSAVEIVVRRQRDDVRLEVLDRGPGIPENALPRVFDPFFTTKDEVHGVGLGLFTAEGLVRTHRGRIRAENRSDGPGARFVVELPASPADAGAPSPPAPPSSGDAPASGPAEARERP